MSTRRLALAGAVGPVVWVLVVTVLTALEWDYLHGRGWDPVAYSDVVYPSSTALGEYGWLQILNFMQLGLSVLALTMGLWRSLTPRPTGALWSLAVVGLAILFSGFPTDGSATAITTWHGAIHAGAFLVFLVAWLASALLFIRASRRIDGWRSLARDSLVAVVLVAVSVPVSSIESIGSLTSTLGLLVIFIWIELLALRLLATTALTTASAAA